MTSRQDIAFHPLGQVPDKARHVALVPGAAVPLLALDLPARLRGGAREDVARRQLRDQLGAAGTGIEMRPFFAPGAADGWRRALVADGAELADWRGQTGAGCRALLPDYLALPAAPDLWVLRVENGSVQARLGLEDGFSADADLARLMLARALEEDGLTDPKAVLMLGDADAGITQMMAARGVAVVQEAGAVEALGLARPQVLGHGELGFDLRADPRAARDRLRRRVLPWRWPLLIGLVAAGLWAAAQIVPTRAMERAVAVERDAALVLVRQNFVPTGPVLDVRVQVARAMAERQAQARDWQGRVSPLTLFGQAAAVIDAAGAVSEEYAYEQKAGLTAVLRLTDFAAAEALVSALRAAGLRVEVVDLRVRDGESGVRAELRMEAVP